MSTIFICLIKPSTINYAQIMYVCNYECMYVCRTHLARHTSRYMELVEHEYINSNTT